MTLNIFVLNVTRDGINGGGVGMSARPAGENSIERQCFLMSARISQTTVVGKKKKKKQTKASHLKCKSV